MDLSPSHWIQLNIAGLLALVAGVVAYILPTRWIIPPLILLLPFPLIVSKFGSINVYLIYLVALIFGVRGQLRHLPYIGFVLLIAFAYAIALTQANPVTMREQLLYLLFIGSDFLLFYLVYNFYKENSDAQGFLYLLVALSGLVLTYSLVQMVVGMNPNSPLFQGEISLKPPRSDGRLTGPFGGVGITAEYMVMTVFISGFILLTARPGPAMRRLLILIILGSLAAMVATANRGAVFTIVFSGLFFLYLFRRELGFRGILIAIGGTGFAFALVATVVINYTDFDRLFERLEETDVEEGMPDTRSKVWPATWALIQERPIAGHGPQSHFSEATYSKRGAPAPIYWPHNLYLYLWYTLGIIGLIAYLAWFGRMYLDYYRASRLSKQDAIDDGLPKLAMVIMSVFIIDQIKVEFLRSLTMEYQHFMFMLWGALAALATRNGKGGVGQQPVRSEGS
ncbi:O-antigen ligase family protein [Thiocapsa marina]|uniref:O-antigen polymerase n=1 Tax=Thiocapsa marina 5811 TaxID=768671 RepID=F9UAQ5_9GAMM|nr:O-antigen ligase family protein [Thiocapsa marina]EGV18523.1 O-antigen polymerase [Thiocapsa marina 5811]